MTSLRSQVIRLASSFPKNSKERKALLNVLAKSVGSLDLRHSKVIPDLQRVKPGEMIIDIANLHSWSSVMGRVTARAYQKDKQGLYLPIAVFVMPENKIDSRTKNDPPHVYYNVERVRPQRKEPHPLMEDRGSIFTFDPNQFKLGEARPEVQLDVESVVKGVVMDWIESKHPRQKHWGGAGSTPGTFKASFRDDYDVDDSNVRETQKLEKMYSDDIFFLLQSDRDLKPHIKKVQVKYQAEGWWDILVTAQ